MGTRVYVGGLDPRVSEAEVEDEGDQARVLFLAARTNQNKMHLYMDRYTQQNGKFVRFGNLRSVWVARKPPGFAFIDFMDPRDADDAVRELNGRNGWRVEFSRAERGGGGGRGGYGGGRGGGGPPGERRCFECGEVGHMARDCRNRGGPPPGRARSPDRYGGGRFRDRSRSLDRGRARRSISPHGRRSVSPRHRGGSRSPRPRSISGSPPPRR